MEGSHGIIVEMGTKTATPVVTPNVEGEVSVQIVPSGRVGQSFASPDAQSRTTHAEEGRVEDLHAQTPNEKQTTDAEKTPEELIAEKRKQVEEVFDDLGEYLDFKTKEKLKKEYLDGALSEDKQQKEGNTLEDTFAEIRRLLVLLIALFLMLILHPDKTHFTGKDLGLEEKAPDGEGNDVLSKLMTGKSLQESWDGFKKEVDGIGKEQPVPFGEFMSLVLAANKRNSVKSLKLKNKEGKSGGLMKNKKPGLFGRVLGLVRRGAPARSRMT